MRRSFVIRNEHGGYYQGTTGIGPAFGNLSDAQKFKSRDDAAVLLMDWRFTGCEIVLVDKAEVRP